MKWKVAGALIMRHHQHKCDRDLLKEKPDLMAENFSEIFSKRVKNG